MIGLNFEVFHRSPMVIYLVPMSVNNFFFLYTLAYPLNIVKSVCMWVNERGGGCTGNFYLVLTSPFCSRETLPIGVRPYVFNNKISYKNVFSIILGQHPVI